MILLLWFYVMGLGSCWAEESIPRLQGATARAEPEAKRKGENVATPKAA